jgi:hypothetical protein
MLSLLVIYGFITDFVFDESSTLLLLPTIILLYHGFNDYAFYTSLPPAILSYYTIFILFIMIEMIILKLVF